MDLEITNIQRKGQQNDEFVEIEVLNDCDLYQYIVADTTFSPKDDAVSNKLRHIYWFPSKKVKKGDKVKLFTGHGRDESIPNGKLSQILNGNNTNKTHKFYWNLNEGVWNDEKDRGILFQWSELQVFPPIKRSLKAESILKKLGL